jgi:Zn-dependent protease
MDRILTGIIQYGVLLFAITIHEASHGWAAHKFGDPTAYSMGRVTLNPIPHIDPIGTVLFPLLMIFQGIPLLGWAKPVPVNPLNLRNPRRDNLWISFAGPLSNFTVAAAFIIISRLIKAANPRAFFLTAGSSGALQPIQVLILVVFWGALINAFLGVFNLIPIPPLDGSGVLMGFLSDEAAEKYDKIRPYGFFIIIGLLILGVLRAISSPIFKIIEYLIFT